MAAAASAGPLKAEPRNLLFDGVKEDDRQEEEMRRHRRSLFERFMATCGPGTRCLYEIRRARSQPCFIYTLKVSVKKARVSWSHRSSRRFLPERRGHAVPIPLCRVVEHDQVEQVVHRSGEAGEPDRPGVLAGIHEAGYYLLELDRMRDHGEVAVLRGMPGGNGITVTSHIDHLVVRLHDILFRLDSPGATVDLRFSEHWFRLPAGWTEERLYAEDGCHVVDIAAAVENLARELCVMRNKEDEELEKQKWETGEERERRLQDEELQNRKRDEERKKIREQKEEEARREREAVSGKRRVRASSIWDAALWEISEAQPAVANRYSKFKLSMNSSKQVSCNCVGQDSLQNMLRRVENGEFILPISKTALPSSSSRARETLGYVEGYFDLEISGFGVMSGCCMDPSGRTMSSVLVLSRSELKVLTIRFLVTKLDILMDDGTVISGIYGLSVDIHCDDISSSELLTTNWAHHILCKNVDVEGMTSFSTLLAQLKKKLQLPLTKEESLLYNMSKVDDAEENNENLTVAWEKQREWVPKPELPEVELHDCSLFAGPWMSEEV